MFTSSSVSSMCYTRWTMQTIREVCHLYKLQESVSHMTSPKIFKTIFEQKKEKKSQLKTSCRTTTQSKCLCQNTNTTFWNIYVCCFSNQALKWFNKFTDNFNNDQLQSVAGDGNWPIFLSFGFSWAWNTLNLWLSSAAACCPGAVPSCRATTYSARRRAVNPNKSSACTARRTDLAQILSIVIGLQIRHSSCLTNRKLYPVSFLIVSCVLTDLTSSRRRRAAADRRLSSFLRLICCISSP